jgi:DNA replication protein DnaC
MRNQKSNGLSAELIERLKYLRLTGLLGNWHEYLKLAGAKNFSHTRLLNYVVEEEYRLKQANALALRLKRARLSERLLIETFPFSKQPKLNKKKTMALYDSLSYMNGKENVIWLGRTGCGKTGLATAFLIHAIEHGYRGRYVLFPELVTEFYASIADHSRAESA